jgi:hypothetical protein
MTTPPENIKEIKERIQEIKNSLCPPGSIYAGENEDIVRELIDYIEVLIFALEL